MGLAHMRAMLSNMILFQTSEISFGDEFLANGGSPETMRPQLERGNGRFRFLVIFPMKKDGGVELALGTFPEELEMFETDEEFTKYAKLVDSCQGWSGYLFHTLSRSTPYARHFHSEPHYFISFCTNDDASTLRRIRPAPTSK